MTNKQTGILVLAGSLVLALMLWLTQEQAGISHTGTANDFSPATLIPAPKIIQPFSLTDHHGQPFTLDNFKGKWTFLFFGFTHCPDVCPTTLQTFKFIHTQLKQSDIAEEPVQFVFITVDPERDTVKQLAEFIPGFNPEFTGVTGDMDTIGKLAAQLGIAHKKSNQGSQGSDYQIEHSSAVLLMDPQARWHALFSAPLDPAAMVEAYRRIVRHNAGG